MTIQRQAFLQSHIDAMNRLPDNSVACRETAAGTRRTLARTADGRTRVEHVAAVRRREPLTRTVEVETAQLHAVSHLPDAVEHRAMALVSGRQSVLLTKRLPHGKRDGIHHAA